MNYNKIYSSIIEKAKNEVKTGYCERHHIIPKSLGGSDDNTNLVLLSAKEHFVCHYLLLKMQIKDSIEYKKMLKAFFMMQTNSKNQQRFLNSRLYEKYRKEFAIIMSESQTGKKNSQYGKHWYTNIDDGKSISCFKKPSERWILGRNILNGQTSRLITKFDKYGFRRKNIEKNKTYNITHNIKKENNYINYMELKCNLTRAETENLWNEFHSTNCFSISDFCNNILNGKLLRIALAVRFQKYIPLYNKLNISYKGFKPNKNLIDKFK